MSTTRVEHLADGVTLYQGDCFEHLKVLPADSIDSVVTDPPYGLGREPDAMEMLRAWIEGGHYSVRSSSGFMGKEWDAFVPQPAVWREIYRALKPGAHVAAFFGTRTYDLGVLAMRLAGFEIRDLTAWLYSSGFPKSQNVAKFIDKELKVEGSLGGPRSTAHADMLARGIARRGEKHEGWDRPWMDDPDAIAAAQSTYIPGSPQAQEFDGFGTALKPAFEPIVLARKPLSEPTVAANVLRWRTGALNIDACRVPVDPEADASQLRTMNRGQRTEDTSGQTWGMSKGGADAPQVVRADGRWPANVVHDGSDEVVGAFPLSASGSGKRPENATAATFGNVTCGPKAQGFAGYADAGRGNAARFFYSAKADAYDRLGSKHPTVKPVDLKQYLARLVTPPGGTVLDPYAGTGTTGEACMRERMKCILIEREPEYQNDIRRRMALALAGPDERARAIVKAKSKDKEPDHGPLFAMGDSA